MNRTVTGLLLAALAAPPMLAQDKPAEAELTVDQIVAKANRVSYYQGRDGRADVKLEIVDAQGRERVREMTILRRDEPRPAEESAGEAEGAEKGDGAKKHDDTYCGEQKFYVRFRRPADVDKTTFLVWKKPGKDDDRWLYLPALDLVKRISSADKRSSFVGSHFFYEDVSGRHVAADTHVLEETTKVYHVVKSTPKDPKGVEFAYSRMYIDRVSFTVVQVDFFDKPEAEQPYRQYVVKGVGEVKGYKTVTTAVMTDLRTKAKTTATYTNIDYDLGMPEDIFTERYLRRAPRKWMR